jgi:hypothetical protein
MFSTTTKTNFDSTRQQTSDNAASNKDVREKKTMAILSNSWVQHLKSLDGNDKAIKNMKAFTETLAAYKTISEQIDALIEEVNAAVQLVGPKNLVQQTHSWIKFGGTHPIPTSLSPA